MYHLTYLHFFSTVPAPSVEIIRSPDRNIVYTITQLILSCVIELDEAVDTEVSINQTWSGPRGQIIPDSHVTISDVTFEEENYYSDVMFSFLQSLDSGNYTCMASAMPTDPEASAFVRDSGTASDEVVVTVGKGPMITWYRATGSVSMCILRLAIKLRILVLLKLISSSQPYLNAIYSSHCQSHDSGRSGGGVS